MDQQFRLLVDGLGFPEAPRWRDGHLWFSDFSSRRVSKVDLDGNVTTVAYVPGQPSGLGFRPDGALLVVSMFDANLLAVTDAGITRIACTASVGPGPTNDMAVDSRGRAYISRFGYHSMYDLHLSPPPTQLAFVDVDGSVRGEGDDLLFANGLTLDNDESHLVVAEFAGNRLTVFDIAPDGSLHSPKLFADLGERNPDGICMDAEGAVWVACPLQRELVRVAPTGEITHTLPAPHGGMPSACALGGPSGRTLFCTTATMSHEEFYQGMARGCIDMIEVDVPGVKADPRTR